MVSKMFLNKKNNVIFLFILYRQLHILKTVRKTELVLTDGTRCTHRDKSDA